MYAALNKALVIDPSGALRDFLRFCAPRLWPKLEIVSYLWARGCPDHTFDWMGFDLVVLAGRLHDPRDRGVDWLRTLRQNSSVPAIVLVADELTENLRREAERAGAAGVFNQDDLSPRQFAECVERSLRGPCVKSIAREDPAVGCGLIVAGDRPDSNLEQRIALGIGKASAVDYLYQIVRSLGGLHAQGLLHRDIKPAHILFRQGGTLVLSDPATEKEVPGNPGLTPTSRSVGDLSYVSPEAIRRETVDARSDLYSAGIVFYQMLTGRPPFRNSSVAAVLEAHLSAAIPRLPQGSEELQPLLEGLLAKDPNERFQSADEALDGIDWLCPERE
jgi:hypothetical protein